MSTIQTTKVEEKTINVPCDFFFEGDLSQGFATIPREKKLKLKINGVELVNILCTPIKLEFLVIGYLYLEGFISGLDDLKKMVWSYDKNEVDVEILGANSLSPKGRTVPVGLGGGAIFEKEIKKVDSDICFFADELVEAIKNFTGYVEERRQASGIHTSALARSKDLVFVADDIGRHNTLDKLAGEALKSNVRIEEMILITTGRVSSEMILKGAKLGVPLVVSRRSPTEGAVDHAKNLGITLIGHAKKNGFSIFSNPERIKFR
ncbi:MAG: formate dehydrogenase accessory sulfurtransferase FdhD [Desulfobacterota bacterium]|nr:formate dehydrogenase accessory sulfurtransferase FdhD [Thermodesulfobacteriota bacterium]MDW8001399.1 formate dehydrogenase accessory sulfurtransferase FdhD [Deltaproteobacteria bacterium]